MPILSLFAPLVSWLIRGVVLKFVILTGVFALMALVIPYAITLISPLLGLGSLNSAFGALDSGVWYFLDKLALGFGVPLVISAFVTRFLIRRLPVIG